MSAEPQAAVAKPFDRGLLGRARQLVWGFLNRNADDQTNTFVVRDRANSEVLQGRPRLWGGVSYDVSDGPGHEGPNLYSGTALKRRGTEIRNGMCAVTIEGSETPTARVFGSVLDHEMVAHCGLYEVLSKDQYDGFIHRMASQVPLDTLRTDWFAEVSNIKSPDQLAAERAVIDPHRDQLAAIFGPEHKALFEGDGADKRLMGYVTAVAYQVKNTLGSEEHWTVKHPVTGRVHVDPASLARDPYLQMYVEEAAAMKATATPLGTVPQRLPPLSDTSPEAAARYARALLTDVRNVYRQTMTEKEFDDRHRRYIGPRGEDNRRSGVELAQRGRAMKNHGMVHINDLVPSTPVSGSVRDRLDVVRADRERTLRALGKLDSADRIGSGASQTLRGGHPPRLPRVLGADSAAGVGSAARKAGRRGRAPLASRASAADNVVEPQSPGGGSRKAVEFER